MTRRGAVTASSPTSKATARTSQTHQDNSHAESTSQENASTAAPTTDSRPSHDARRLPSTSPSTQKPSRETTAPSAALLAKKKIVRPPKFHETTTFLKRESAVRPQLASPWHLGHRVGETYRVAATLHRAMDAAALQVRPVSWGYGTKDGTLGHNNTQHLVSMLKRVAAFRHEHLHQVSAGDKLSLFLTNAGQVLQCGRLFLRQDGVKMWRPRQVSFERRPEEVDEVVESVDDAVAVKHEPVESDEEPVKIVSVEAGHLAAYAIDEEGRIYSWGTKRYGQLGNGDDGAVIGEGGPVDGGDGEQGADQDRGVSSNEDANGESEEEDEQGSDEGDAPKQRSVEPVERWPRRIQSEATNSIRFVKLSAGNHFVLALSSCGRVFSWGWNWHGQLGLGTDIPRHGVDTPHVIQHGLQPYAAVDIAAGHSHSLVVALPRTQDASQLPQYAAYTMVFAFGAGRRGRLGVGGESDQTEPVEVSFFRGLHATHVAAGHDHSVVLCSIGSKNCMYSFGGNAFGQLGIAQTTMSCSDMPMAVEELSGFGIAAVGAGAYVSSALTSDGQVYTWGDGTHGKTAREDTRTTFVPWQVPSSTDAASKRVVLSDDSFVTQLSMGAHHSIALYRVSGKPDRWRKFPLESVASYLHVDEGQLGSCHVVCGSSYAAKPTSVFGILLHCETCGLGPVCRVCTRRCHANHKLVPRRLVSTARDTEASDARVVHCACGQRRPPPPPPRVASQKATGKPRSMKSDSIAQEMATDDSAGPVLAPAYCCLATLPLPITEDALLR